MTTNDNLRGLLEYCKGWIESAKDGVLYPVASEFQGVVGSNAEGLGQLAVALLQRIDAALAAPDCSTCQDSRVVSTTDKDHNGDHIEQRCPDCAHTPQDDYEHFLSYSGLRDDPKLRYAYFHGANQPCEKPDSGEVVPTDAARDVLAERQRQISAEGWTTERDDRHNGCEMAAAAAVYATCTQAHQLSICGAVAWPWSGRWWKPSTYRRNLIKAAALLLAEIERIDRAELNKAPAKAELVNQCDGCRAGIPVVNGFHRMGKPGGYADLTSCTANRYTSKGATK